MRSKQCTGCGQSKPVDNFGKRQNGKSGLKAACKECAAEYARAYRKANLETVRANHQKYNKANPEKTRAWTKAWQEANREKVNSYARDYRQANREVLREKDRRWSMANREIRRNNDHLRRARIAGAGYFLVTKKDIARVLMKDCAYCGAASEHIDHVIPIAKGGSHKVGNLVAACSSCNLRKGSKFLSVWKLEKSKQQEKVDI